MYIIKIMKNRKLITTMGVVSSYFSFVTFSFAEDAVSNITGTLGQIVKALELVIIPAAITVAFAYFFYNGVKFLAAGDGESEGKSSKIQLIWSVVGLFVLVSIWGILYLFIQVTGVDGTNSQSIPKFDAESKLYIKATEKQK